MCRAVTTIKPEPATPTTFKCLNGSPIAPKTEDCSPSMAAQRRYTSPAATASSTKSAWKNHLKHGKSNLAISLSSPSPTVPRRKAAPVAACGHPKPPPPLPPAAGPPQQPLGASPIATSLTRADTATAIGGTHRGDTGGTGAANKGSAGTSETKRIHNAFENQKRYMDPDLNRHYKDLKALYPKGSPERKEFKKLIGACSLGNFDTPEIRAVRKRIKTRTKEWGKDM